MKTIIFDLDGTLIDSTELTISALYNTLDHFTHIPKPSRYAIKKAFGLPDEQYWNTLLPEATDMDKKRIEQLFNKHLHENMYNVSILYPHTVEVLSELQRRGYTLTTASNCGVRHLNTVLDSQGIRHFFTNPLCLESVHGQKKEDILTKHFTYIPKTNAFMVGDRDVDLEAAQKHGIPFIGCLYGFGDPSELSGAQYSIASILDLLMIFE